MSTPPLPTSVPPVTSGRRESFARRAESLMEQVISFCIFSSFLRSKLFHLPFHTIRLVILRWQLNANSRIQLTYKFTHVVCGKRTECMEQIIRKQLQEKKREKNPNEQFIAATVRIRNSTMLQMQRQLQSRYLDQLSTIDAIIRNDFPALYFGVYRLTNNFNFNMG